MNGGFRKRIRQNLSSVLLTLGAIAGLIAPFFTGWFTAVLEQVVYSLIIITIFLSSMLVLFGFRVRQLERKMDDYEDLESKVQDYEEYHDVIDSKHTQPVKIEGKNLSVQIREEEADRIEYSNSISASEGHTIDEFYGMIGTDREVEWVDLNLDVNNASIDGHYRRDFENMNRFIIKFELNDIVTQDDSYELSYSVEQNVVDIESDYAYLVIRHPTDRVKITLHFQEPWKPIRNIVTLDEGDGSIQTRAVNQPGEPEFEDGNWVTNWSSNSCRIGDRFKLDYRSEEQDDIAVPQ